jgi:hypothetical protein
LAALPRKINADRGSLISLLRKLGHGNCRASAQSRTSRLLDDKGRLNDGTRILLSPPLAHVAFCFSLKINM